MKFVLEAPEISDFVLGDGKGEKSWKKLVFLVRVFLEFGVTETRKALVVSI